MEFYYWKHIKLEVQFFYFSNTEKIVEDFV